MEESRSALPLSRPGRRKLKASEILARDLAVSIVDGDLRDGTRLPAEAEMLAQMEVGRATLREALRLLESWGLITIRTGPGGGPLVRRPELAEFSEQLGLLLQFQGFTLADVSDARMALEPLLAELAAERITDDGLVTLRKSIDEMREFLEDHSTFWAQNQIFHSGIAQAANAPVLQMFVEATNFLGHGTELGVEYSTEQMESIALAHERILDALVARDPEAAAEEMRRHLLEGRKYGERRYPASLRRMVRWPREHNLVLRGY